MVLPSSPFLSRGVAPLCPGPPTLPSLFSGKGCSFQTWLANTWFDRDVSLSCLVATAPLGIIRPDCASIPMSFDVRTALTAVLFAHRYP